MTPNFGPHWTIWTTVFKKLFFFYLLKTMCLNKFGIIL